MLYAMSWFLISCLIWILSVTIGLPLTLSLKYSETFRRKFFPFILVNLVGTRIYQPRVISWKKKVFGMLRESLGTRDKSVPLEVLEIGVGAGANLEFYPENCNLTVLDRNKNFEGYFYRNSKKFSHINYKETVICPAEDMRRVPDNSKDLVVSTFVQCYCPKAEDVLKEVKRVLKPGGKYIFMEHVKFPNGTFGLFLQRFIKPIWEIYSDGCNLDRDTGTKIKSAGFSHVICDNIVVKEWWMYLASNEILGIATK